MKSTKFSTLRRWGLILLSGLALQAPAQDFPKNLTADDKTYMLSKFWSEVKFNFVYFDQMGEARWDSLYQAYLPRVRQTPDDQAFFDEMRRFCALLRDGHTHIGWSGSSGITTYFDQLQWYLDRIGGKAIVTRINQLNRERIPVGTEIISVNGLPTDEYIRQNVLPLISSSTDYVRWDVATRSMLQGPEGSSFDVEVRTPKGKTLTLHLKHTFEESVQSDPLYPAEQNHPLLELKWYPNDVAYVALNSFGDPKIISQWEAIFPELRKRAKKLILDLRRNGGGNTGTGAAILKYLTPDSRLMGSNWYTRVYGAAYAAWGEGVTPADTVGDAHARRCYLTRRGQYMEGEEGNAFEVPASLPRLVIPTVVLTEHRTASAAEDFLILADGQKHFTRIGRPSNGSTGQPIRFSLGHGFSARICTKKDTYPDGRPFVGVGIKPDIVVEPTAEDFIKGRDAQLEAALDFLKKQR